jgi:formylglycine-generating enzyme required for sulfatase activity
MMTGLPHRSNEVGGWFDCFRLATEPGSKWIVTEKEPLLSSPILVELKVGFGSDCTQANWLLHATEPSFGVNTKLEFTAGGGNYLVLVKGKYGKESIEFEANEVSGPAEYPALEPVPEYTAPAGTASTLARMSDAQYRPGDAFSDCPACPRMVALPAGTFMMGSGDFEEGRVASEGPRHLVKLAQAFALSATEVSFDQYEACVQAFACAPVADQGWGRGNRPAINVTLTDAINYVAWLTATTGHSYFIPSEAEWEYAARSGTDTPWNTGSAIITSDANFLDQFDKTVPVGSYPPNAFGLHDMHGNVSEWVLDCMDTGYLGVPTDGSAVLKEPCGTRIVRGGSFRSDHAATRSAARLTVDGNARYATVGFRVARAL